MANRFNLGKRTDNTYGLDISRPTYNVLTATNEQLQFSTKWGHSGSIHQQGTFLYSDGATVTFPTLSYAPMILVAPIYGGNTNWAYWTDTYGPPSYDAMIYSVYAPLIQLTNSAFVVRNNPLSGYAPIPVTDFYYAVFRIPGGGGGDI